MISIQLTFAAALFFSLAATPKVRSMAEYFGLTDVPSFRKMHLRAIPRIGGVAIFLSFLFPFALLFLLRKHSGAAQQIFSGHQPFCLFLGATLIFLLGLLDDLRVGLSFKIKFVGQIFVAALTYFCGIQINVITNPFGGSAELGMFSLPVTVFWLVLVINAINLIDGLDGLAAGICLFASLSMLVVCAVNRQLASALAFASLAGASAGFLRYNFNPASIFMGDSGSYFLGYCLAALSISGTMKGQMTTALLMPVIALGVPLIDALWAPVRRFAAGQHMFQPDMQHVHHKLVQRGCTQRKAVLLIYAMTIFLSIGAVILVHSQSEISALILFFMSAAGIATVRYLRLSDLITVRKMSLWARSLTRDLDFSLENRYFFSQQFDIAQADSLEELWVKIENVFKDLKIDRAEFTCMDCSSASRHFHWNCGCAGQKRELMLKIELPLYDSRPAGCGCHLGSLLLLKNMEKETLDDNILKKIGLLRQSMIVALKKMNHS